MTLRSRYVGLNRHRSHGGGAEAFIGPRHLDGAAEDRLFFEPEFDASQEIDEVVTELRITERMDGAGLPLGVHEWRAGGRPRDPTIELRATNPRIEGGPPCRGRAADIPNEPAQLIHIEVVI